MQRTLKLALTAVLGVAAIVPAFAQDNFPDVPENHWAYEALLRMKSNGLLVGYPDGRFRGARPASRYEMAVAIHATYVNLKNITDGLQKQIDELKGMSTGSGDAQGSQNLRGALENLQNDVSGLKKWGDDIAALRRLTDTFQKELQDLNVNVEQMKKDLKDLQDRVTVLEKVKPAISISGDANLWVASGHGTDGRGHLNKDGRFAGARLNGGVVNGTSFLQDLTVLHEGAFKFSTTNETGPKFAATLVSGNMLGGGNTRGAFYNQGLPTFGTAYYESAGQDVYFQDFSVKFDSAVAGLGVNAEIGRTGYKISPLVLQRPDFTTYFANDRWDNGEYLFDGAILGFNFGKVKLDVFGGRSERRLSNNGIELQPMMFGSNYNPLNFRPDRNLGANVNIPIGNMGGVNLSYLLYDSNVAAPINTTNFNRVEILGADANFKLGQNLKLTGAYAQTNLKRNDSTRRDDDNIAFNAMAEYMGGSFGVGVGYRRVEENFVAPGDWGRLGFLRNATNLEGFQAKAHLNLGSSLTLRAGGEILEGVKNFGAGVSAFGTNTEVTSFNVGLDYKLSPNFTVMLGYEDTEFEGIPGFAGAKPRYRWYNLGLGYGISETTMLHIGYEISDHKNDIFTNGFAASSPNGQYRGGFFTTQLSVKF